MKVLFGNPKILLNKSKLFDFILKLAIRPGSARVENDDSKEFLYYIVHVIYT
jgi:hypothetical protein